MKIGDLMQESYSALANNKARSGLTMLGIIIGIGSVIAMVSIGQGAQSSIESNIQSIGSNLIMVTPGAQRNAGSAVRMQRGSAQSLTLADTEALKNLSYIKSVAPEVSSRYQVIYKSENTNTSVYGVTPEYISVKSLKVTEGSFISEQNIKSYSKVAVLGPTTKDDLFGSTTESVIGKTIKINKMEFKVIGITEAKGGSGMMSQDDRIFIPLTTAQRFFIGSEYVSTINVEAKDTNSMSLAQEQITALLLERHKITDSSLADFSTMNQSDIVSAASSVTSTFTMLLAAIAGISLVVGGIGIMNMMLTTVTERTREIGLRKAIGATRNDISSQFLTEAVILTFLGGLFGILFGWGISILISKFASMTTEISTEAILLAFGVSAAIGLIFGYYPARRAAKLNPIEALRFE